MPSGGVLVVVESECEKFNRETANLSFSGLQPTATPRLSNCVILRYGIQFAFGPE
jgi:hypothetical protein